MVVLDIVEEVHQQILLGILDDEIVDHDHQENVMDVQLIEHIVIVINKNLNVRINVIQDLVHHHQKPLEIKS
jgi:frataxin-like iron-binding protein CyaY